MLADAIVPVRDDLWPLPDCAISASACWASCGLRILAYLGIPAAAVLTDTIVVFGSLAVAGYLMYRGRYGAQAARVAAPSAMVFALVAVASVAATLNNSGESWATSAAGGFAAAGVAAARFGRRGGRGDRRPAVPVHRRHARPRAVAACRRAARRRPACRRSARRIRASSTSISRPRSSGSRAKPASLIGLSDHATPIAHADWIQHIHAEDREVYIQALDDYRSHPGLAFRVEFRLRSESGRYPWFELRATMLGDRAPAARCLGLMADVTTRKEGESELLQRTLRDPLTGLGNRVAMMEELEQLTGRFPDTTFAVIDIDRFKSIHASLGDDGADALLAKIAERLVKRFKGVAEVFRVGGDAFAFVFAQRPGPPRDDRPRVA